MPNLITGKTVYLLGAGASYHAGAPLLNNFLARSRSLLSSNKSLKWKTSFENVFKWIDTLRSTAYYLDIDLDNLEHIFSLISMMEEVNHPGATELYTDMSRVIFETIDNECSVNHSKESYSPDPIYNEFVDTVLKISGEHERVMPGTKDALVTLNYDVMLDYVLWYSHHGCEYCLTDRHNPNLIKLLKLHGSINWGLHQNCPKASEPKPQIVRASPIAEGFMSMARFRDEDETVEVPFKMFTHTLWETKCTACQNKHALDPIFIPPTWFKSCKKAGIENVWRQTIEEFKSATQIVIIGYSLPATDTFLPYLLTLGLSQNADLYRVIIVNPDSSDNFMKRYERVFSRSLMERKRLKFLNMNFEQFVGQSMEKTVSNLEW